MYNKDRNIDNKVKRNRYNEINLVGSYGIKDELPLGTSNKNNEKGEVSWLMWLGIITITMIPIVNIIFLLVMALTNINMIVKNFAKAALIFIIMGVILLLLYL